MSSFARFTPEQAMERQLRLKRIREMTLQRKREKELALIKKDAELAILISGFPRNIGGKILEVSDTKFTILVYKKRIVKRRDDDRDFYYCPDEIIEPMEFEMKHVDSVVKMKQSKKYNEDYDSDFDDLDMFDDALNFMLPDDDETEEEDNGDDISEKDEEEEED